MTKPRTLTGTERLRAENNEVTKRIAAMEREPGRGKIHEGAV